jgi:uncharacterized protein YcbK (DUF882 family)
MSRARALRIAALATMAWTVAWPGGTAAAQPSAPASAPLPRERVPPGEEPLLASLPPAPSSSRAPALPVSKKARLLEEKRGSLQPSDPHGKRWRAQLDRRIGKPAPRVVNIFNTWTHEFLPVEQAEEVTDERRNRFFRCHFTNQPTSIDARLFRTLLAAARHFGSERIDVVSGYRAPKYNLMLRKKGREVARNSQHTLGSAIDFRLPGVPVRRLHAWARGQGLGGVGLYPASGFIHMDTGPVRYWNGR